MALLLALLALAACNPARGVPVFLWHGVGPDCAGPRYDVPVAEFDAELSTLEKWGATPITLAQLFDARDGKAKLPARPVILTFDDGRLCQLTAALPVLEKHHMVAETFVSTDHLAEDAAHRHVAREDDLDQRFLTWPELMQLEHSGRFVAESHGLDHRRFADLSEAAQRRELVESKRALEQRLGRKVEFFAYPFGSFTSTSRDLAEQAGYRAAVSVQKGLSTRYAIQRTSVWAGYAAVVDRALADAFGRPPAP
jgi:peptidoglycan/xylan/chitin deacetylase (PgdA/CDA1 family)